MGLFNAIKKSKPASVPSRRDLQKAMMLVGCAMTMADGSADDVEITRMRSGAARMPLFHSNSGAEDEAIMHEAASEFERDRGVAMSWAFSILQHQNWRAVACCYMCEIMMADGEIDEDEMDVLNNAAQELGLDIDDAQAIFTTFNTYYQKYEG